MHELPAKNGKPSERFHERSFGRAISRKEGGGLG